MQLSDWLSRNDRSAAWLAKRLEVSRATVGSWLAGDFLPALPRVAKIEEITGGEVRLTDLLSIPRRGGPGGPSLVRPEGPSSTREG